MTKQHWKRWCCCDRAHARNVSAYLKGRWKARLLSAMRFAPDQTITEIAGIFPEAIAIFEEAEIDFSCKGLQSLADAANENGYRVEDLIERLARAQRRNGEIRWYVEPLSALMSFLIDDHANTISVRLPAIRNAIESAVKVYGDRLQDLARICVLFGQLVAEMTTHVLKEERELFPYIRDLELATEGSAPMMRIAQRVLRELVEHESFRDRLRTMHELAERLPPDDASSTIRNEVRQFRREVHRHMHLENNVLYPRAIEIENSLRRSAIANS